MFLSSKVGFLPKGNWFALRAIDPWNSLPESVVTAPSIASLKTRYYRYVELGQVANRS